MISLIITFSEKMCKSLDKFYSKIDNKNMLFVVELNEKS